jgi:hypothetical protein
MAAVVLDPRPGDIVLYRGALHEVFIAPRDVARSDAVCVIFRYVRNRYGGMDVEDVEAERRELELVLRQGYLGPGGRQEKLDSAASGR